MSNKIKSVFENKILTLPLDNLLPTRDVKATDRSFGKYKMILATIPHVGLIEPIAVYPCRGRKGSYIVLDGHLRLKALRELGHETALCLISTEDDPFTYNDKVNRLSAIQENRMIIKAIEQGVKQDDIAKAMNIDVEHIRRSVNLLEGIDPKAVDLLKDKPVTAATLRLFKKVKAPRQHAFARLMVTVGDYSFVYAQAMLLATTPDMLVSPEKPKVSRMLKPEVVAQMETEMGNLEQEFRIYQENYGKSVLSLSVARRYIERLLGNAAINRFLAKNYPEIHEELGVIASSDAL
jgi:hypothetical protein